MGFVPARKGKAMDNEVRVSVTGWVGRSPETHDGSTGRFLSFTVACTPSYFDRSAGAWKDQQTEWFLVNVPDKGQFIDNVLQSVHKRQPVTVSGRLKTRQYTDKDGKNRTELVIVADRVGHDLRKGDARFRRYRPNEPDADGIDIAGGPVPVPDLPVGEEPDPWDASPDAEEYEEDPGLAA
jgi:single-strand DNA-binding protein